MAQTPCKFYQAGDVIDYTPVADVALGQVVVLGTRLVGIAPAAITANELGALSLTGAWKVPKVTGSITKGSALYWDDDANPLGGDAGSGAFTTNSSLGPFAGFAAETSATGTILMTLESRDASSTTLRSALGQDDLAVYELELDRWKDTATPVLLGASAGTPSGAFGLTVGTHGTAPHIIKGEAASGNSKTNKMRTQFTLPPEYVAGQTVTLRVVAHETVGAATVSTTVDAEVYVNAKTGSLEGSPTDLCATAAIDVTTSAGNKDFTLTPTDLAPGDTLDIEITGVTNDTGGSVGTVLGIYSVALLLDIKG